MGSAAFVRQTVNVFGGMRNPFAAGKNILFTIFDGFRSQIYRSYKKATSVSSQVPFFQNQVDDYTDLAYADSYMQAGFAPVKALAARKEQEWMS
ncbi:MAG TPA: hypothetical protein VN893_18175 [Bryobacteraceae bacterium]|nr:hypothetical protein [Bryobacteraceae bacterium]